MLLNFSNPQVGGAIQLGFMVAVIFTFPLQLFPAIQVLEKELFAPRTADSPETASRELRRSVLRTGLVCVLAGFNH